MTKCPIEAADRRLRDALHHWKKLEENYFHSESFRINLNSFIQEARNVTFVLQAQKNKLTGFDQWYQPWQERLKSDPVMRWIVESRNRIAKVGDLDTNSFCSIDFITDWTGEFTQRFSCNPLISTTTLLRSVRVKIRPENVCEESLLCLERRWEDVNLPHKELLSATSYVLLTLFELISDAHDAIVQTNFHDCICGSHQTSIRLFNEYPIALANAHDSRKVWVKYSETKEVKYDLKASNLEESDLESWKRVAKERYGFEFGSDSQQNPTANPLEPLADRFLEIAKIMLAKDKHLQTFIFAFTKHSVFTLSLFMEDRAGKHIAIRRAADLLKHVGAEQVILIGEGWTAQSDESTQKLYRHAEHFPNRGEAIMVNVIDSTGMDLFKHVPFTRESDTFHFKEGSIVRGRSNIMFPILTAISRPIS